MADHPTFPIPAGTPPAKCRSCQADIYWIKTAAGKSMPVSTAALFCSKPTDVEDGAGISHFADCPNAAQHRKAKT